MEFVLWLNENEGLINGIAVFSSLMLSLIAIGITVITSKEQNKIALFNEKYDIYKDLESYISGFKGLPKAVSNFQYPGIKLSKENAWAPEINEITGRAELLFSKKLGNRISELRDRYTKIRKLDDSLDSYLARLPVHPLFIEKTKERFMYYLQEGFESQKDNESFRKICVELSISVDEQVDQDKYETFHYNFYDLYTAQLQITREVQKEKTLILELMRNEIRPI